jgi:hypothetical protein
VGLETRVAVNNVLKARGGGEYWGHSLKFEGLDVNVIPQITSNSSSVGRSTGPLHINSLVDGFEFVSDSISNESVLSKDG